MQQQIPGSELFEDEGRTSKSVDVVVGLGYTAMVPLPPRFDPLPSEITMNVYNTTFRTGLASTVAKDLKGRGFKIKDVSNDPQKTLQMGTALIRYGEEGDLAAKIVAQHLPGATLRKDERAGTSVDVVIGNAYTALVPQQRSRPGTPPQAGDADGRPPLRVGRLEGSEVARAPARAAGRSVRGRRRGSRPRGIPHHLAPAVTTGTMVTHDRLAPCSPRCGQPRAGRLPDDRVRPGAGRGQPHPGHQRDHRRVDDRHDLDDHAAGRHLDHEGQDHGHGDDHASARHHHVEAAAPGPACLAGAGAPGGSGAHGALPRTDPRWAAPTRRLHGPRLGVEPDGRVLVDRGLPGGPLRAAVRDRELLGL